MVAYVVAFILCWIGPLTHRIVEAFYNNSFLPLIYLDSIGMSVQGFVSSIGKTYFRGIFEGNHGY